MIHELTVHELQLKLQRAATASNIQDLIQVLNELDRRHHDAGEQDPNGKSQGI